MDCVVYCLYIAYYVWVSGKYVKDYHTNGFPKIWDCDLYKVSPDQYTGRQL